MFIEKNVKQLHDAIKVEHYCQATGTLLNHVTSFVCPPPVYCSPPLFGQDVEFIIIDISPA